MNILAFSFGMFLSVGLAVTSSAGMLASVVPLDGDFLFELLLNGVVIGDLVVSPVEVDSVGEGVRGDCAAPSAHVFRGHLPPFLCVLLGLVRKFLLLIHVARGSNFLVLCRAFALSHVLDQLVHLGHPLVVFVEACDLAVQQIVLLVSHVQMSLQAVDVGA